MKWYFISNISYDNHNQKNEEDVDNEKKFETLIKLIVLDINTKYSNIIDTNNQIKGFSNSTLLNISNILFEHTGKDINNSEHNAFTIY